MISATERVWVRRLRWRLRGAWQWPAFAALTLVDGVILNRLPPAQTGVDLIPALLLASIGNLFLVGAVAPWLARRLSERRSGAVALGAEPAVPLEVTLDRTATALLVAGAVGLVAAGLAARPAVISETEATETNARLVTEYVMENGSEEYVRNLASANTVRMSKGYFRTCVAADDRRRALCMFVNTRTDPPEIQQDTSPVPNSVLFGGDH